MRTLSLVSRSFIIAPFLLTMAAPEPAHAIDVTPLTYHFGEVEIGASSSTVITIVNYTGHSHTLTAVAFTEESSPDFSIATVLDLPMTLASMDRLELEIVFAPSTAGLLLADLQIRSIDSSLKIVTVSLQGGPGAASPPGACAP